jgi:ABC-type transport system substrate-binding protein
VLTGHAEDEYRLTASTGWSMPRGNVRDVHYLVGDLERAASRWVEGELDLIRIVRIWPDDAIASPQTVVESAAGLTVWYVGFVSDRPPFDDVRIRQAFSHATDRRSLSAAPGTIPGEPATRGGMIPPAMPAHSHRVGLPYDPDLARRLLAEAGFPEGQGLPELTLVARVQRSGESLAQQWQEALGAKTRVVPLPAGSYEGSGAHAVLDGWIADYPDPQNFLEAIHAIPNMHLLRDDRVDKLLAQARALRDRRARVRVYEDIEHIWITEQAAVLPLDYFRQHALRRPWVDGYWVNSCSSAPLEQVTLRRPEAASR